MTLVAVVLLFLAIWIAVPAPSVWLLPLSVGVPELSPVLLLACVIVFLLSFRKGIKKLAALIALIAAGISAMPLLKLSATIKTFDAAIAATFPEARPAAEGMRPKPVAIRDIFLGIQTGQPRIQRAVQFAAPQGLPLVVDIYRPETVGPFPVLVQIHGGAWQRGSRADNETFARYFATRGYVVIAIEYRLAPRWKWPAQFEDVRTALAWIRAGVSKFEGDPRRIAIVGRSSGAQLALLAAYTDGAEAVVSYYGPTDLEEGWTDLPKPDPASVRSVLQALLGGTPESAPDRYREASPITYASGAVPTLQIHGLRDNVVRPRFPRELHQRLQSARGRSVLLEIPWANHAFDAVPQGLGGQLSLYYTERFLAAVFPSRRGTVP